MESGGDTPAGPVSSRTAGSPRHTGDDGDGVGVGEVDGWGVALRVAGGDGERVGVLVALPVELRVPLHVPLPVPEAVARGVPDGLRSDAMARPRYVSRATASSPPPAASHSTDSSTPLLKLLLGISCVTLTSR